jgi:antirestriction protein ArdC
MRMLEEGISGITSTGEFKRYLSFTRSFRTYSPNNTMLIWLQRPDATMVAGYRKWQEHGRQVRKGEKAIKILAPVVRKVEGEDTGEQVRKVVGFRDANVFAYESTEGEPLPSPPMTGRVEVGVESTDRLYSALSRICEAYARLRACSLQRPI